jgi:hypothetical protein
MTVKDDVEAFLVDHELERTRQYVHEGPRFKSVTEDDITARWIAAFKERSANPPDPELGKRVDDLQAEMGIRGLTPPYDKVEKEAEGFIKFVSDAGKRLATDPKRMAEANEELQADIDAVKAKRDSSAKN